MTVDTDGPPHPQEAEEYMNAIPADPGRPAQAPGDAATAAQVRRARLRAAAAARGVPLATILVSVAVVVLTYLAGKLAYAFGNLLTSLIAGLVVFVTLTVLGVPFPLLWAVWVALVDFLPMIGGALAGIPTVLFALGHSLTAGLVTAAAFLAYQQIENHVLNPVVMSRTVKINPLLVLLSILAGTSIGSWVGGSFGAFVAALLSIPVAGALQVIARELWQITGQPGPPDGEEAAGPEPPAGGQQRSGTDREPDDSVRPAAEDTAAVPVADATAARLP
jgi:AI-2E family transporter